MSKRLVCEIACLVLFLCLVPGVASMVGNYQYQQGYANGYEPGRESGYATGYQIGHADGHQSGLTDGYASGYADGQINIECWVIQNHPIVYALYFNGAFLGVSCP